MSNMRLAIIGAGGRMGRTLTRLVHETEGCEVAGGTERPGSEYAGEDMGVLAGLGPINATVTETPLDLFASIDGVIDFSSPQSSVEHSVLAAQARIVHVIGTTGFSSDDEAKIKAAARHARIIKAGNMSLGVNLLTALVKRAARSLGAEFDIEVVEMHHRHKVDAPSGTALMLGQAAADGRGVDLADHSVRSRDGHTGARTSGDIGFATLRGGSVVGEHSVVFAGESERIEITHRAESRDIFARGAIQAALWGRNQKPGLYTMTDVLGIDD